MRTFVLAIAALTPVAAPALAQSPPQKQSNSTASLAAELQVEEKSIAELSAMLADGRTSSEGLTKAYIARIAALDRSGPKLNSVIALLPGALAEARALDAERQAGRLRGPLHGIPILIKDNIEAQGPVPTTAGSTALLANVTNRDAPLVARLRAAGAVILGKTNLSQWANIRSNNSTSGWSRVGGLVKNPYALDRNSCGSSSGSGAAGAASLAAATIGTETDGSIICPSSTNGLVGFKPTLGLVSRTHVVPISHSQDTAGPMARSVTDAALVLTALAGSDAADTATVEADARRTDYAADLSPDYLKGVRIGVLTDRKGSNARVHAAFDAALATLKAAGAVLVEIKDSRTGLDGLGEAEFKVLMTELKADLNAYLASTPDAVTTRTLKDVIAFNTAHADSELAWFDQGLFDMAESQKGLDDPDYIAALAKSKRLAGAEGIDALLGKNDVRFLVGPSNAPAWVSDLVNGDNGNGPSQSQLPAVAGYPHITVPMGYAAGLPLGLSIIGGQWQDHDVIKAGYAFEQASKVRVAPLYAPRADAVADPINR